MRKYLCGLLAEASSLEFSPRSTSEYCRSLSKFVTAHITCPYALACVCTVKYIRYVIQYVTSARKRSCSAVIFRCIFRWLYFRLSLPSSRRYTAAVRTEDSGRVAVHLHGTYIYIYIYTNEASLSYTSRRQPFACNNPLVHSRRLFELRPSETATVRPLSLFTSDTRHPAYIEAGRQRQQQLATMLPCLSGVFAVSWSPRLRAVYVRVCEPVTVLSIR